MWGAPQIEPWQEKSGQSEQAKGYKFRSAESAVVERLAQFRHERRLVMVGARLGDEGRAQRREPLARRLDRLVEDALLEARRGGSGSAPRDAPGTATT